MNVVNKYKKNCVKMYMHDLNYITFNLIKKIEVVPEKEL